MGHMTQSIILPVILPDVHRFKKNLTDKLNDKFVMKQPIATKMLGCGTL